MCIVYLPNIRFVPNKNIWYILWYNMYVQCIAQRSTCIIQYTFCLSNIFLSSENEARFVFFPQRLFFFVIAFFGVHDVRVKKRNLTSLRTVAFDQTQPKVQSLLTKAYQVYTIKLHAWTFTLWILILHIRMRGDKKGIHTHQVSGCRNKTATCTTRWWLNFVFTHLYNFTADGGKNEP